MSLLFPVLSTAEAYLCVECARGERGHSVSPKASIVQDVRGHWEISVCCRRLVNLQALCTLTTAHRMNNSLEQNINTPTYLKLFRK
ncbi:hypothetical protein J6590_080053 [Homalodisca vitripennis]|nr:hypothetical protein J6590_080053 [Homalodisca vitripennis]